MSEVSQQAQQLYLDGLKLFGEDKHREAIEVYDRCLGEAPEWTDAMHAKAMALMHLDDLDQAVEIGRRICVLDGDDAFAHTSLSIFYQRKSAAAEAAGDEAGARELIELAEKEGARARMISWKEELKRNPNAPPPGPAGSMDVIQ
jgi:tetratricopeptide (TPR) repeat protein